MSIDLFAKLNCYCCLRNICVVGGGELMMIVVPVVATAVNAECA